MLAMTEGLMLTIEEVADKLSISVMTVRRMVERGEMPAYRLGGQFRFKESEVDSYVDSQRVEPAKPKNAQRPARLSAGEMAKVGVDYRQENNGEVFLTCQNCGSAWSPNMLAGGKLPRNYWRCPKGCNSDERLAARGEGATND